MCRNFIEISRGGDGGGKLTFVHGAIAIARHCRDHGRRPADGEVMLQSFMSRARKVFAPKGDEERLAALSREDRELITAIRARKLTYLSKEKLASLLETCRAIEQAGLPGLFLEAGCALGGSAALIASTKSVERPFFVYDVFGMIPPPTIEDTQDVHDRYKRIVEGKSNGIGGDPYYGYQDHLYERVQSNLRSFGIDCEAQSVTLIKGLVQDTMKIDQPVAFAHVDVDWYEPVMTCLTRVFPRLVSGGSIILDDYHDWGGCRKATDEYLMEVAGQYVLDDSARSLKITRV